MKTIRWGILGCGSIASKFCKSMEHVENSVILACASRTVGKAEEFGKKFDIPDAYESYEELLKRSDIEAVYVATTHNFHHDNVLLALEWGKGVLCEKPLAVNAEEAKAMVKRAREKDCFLMEAMWTRFLPAMRQVKEWVTAGEIGEIKTVRANFCFAVPFDAMGRLFNPDLAGGALLDAGIYPISFASMIMGCKPEKVVATADIGQTGVDEQSAYILKYRNGCLAILSSAITSKSENRVEISGSKGRIIIPSEFLGAQEVELHRMGEEPKKLKFPFKWKVGFSYEISAVNNALRNQLKECAIMPMNESIEIAETMDQIKLEFCD